MRHQGSSIGPVQFVITRRNLAALLGFVLAALMMPTGAAAQDAPQDQNPNVGETLNARSQDSASQVSELLRGDVLYLASEELRGRGTDSESIDVAATYIDRRMKEIGLDTTTVDGTSLQPLSITFESKPGASEDNRLTFTVTHSDGAAQASSPKSATVLKAAMGTDMNPMAVGTVSGNVSGPLVFAGFGITAKKLGYDDYAGIDVKDKVVVILRREPTNNSGKGPFSGNQNTRHAFFATKIRNAIDHEAAAVILVNDQQSIRRKIVQQENRIKNELNRRRDLETKLQKLPVQAVNNRKSFADKIKRLDQMVISLKEEKKAIDRGLMGINDAGTSNMVYSDKDRQREKLIPVVSMTRSMFNQLLELDQTAGVTTGNQANDKTNIAAATMTVNSLEADINREIKPVSFHFAGTRVRVRSRLTPSTRVSSNVIGVIDGKGRLAEETIVIGAHYDHVGMGRFGSLAPDTIAIHNGADDNASGVAILLATAKNLVERLQPLPDHRRIVVIAFTGEEMGLLGSKYYVRNPRYPLESTVAMLNMDMVGRLRDNELTIYGTGSAKPFDAMIETINATTKFDLFKIPTGYGPSDHQSFYEVGIPVMFFFTGLHNDYHRPTDDFDKIDFGGMTRITDMVSECSFQLAVRPQRPEYAKTERSFRMRHQEPAFIGVSLSQRSDHVVISAVVEDGPAKRGGIQVGDRLIQMDGMAIRGTADVITVMRNHHGGETIKVEVSRRQQRLILPIKLARRPSP